jgi:XTP/dITP diphosphohydrolase
MIPPRLVLATANPGKVVELEALVREWGRVDVVSLAAFPGVAPGPEGGETYAENAIAKARAVAAATGLPALGDDSGLEVDALGGAPGVHSRRWAGASADDRERNERILTALARASGAARTARFRCVVALAWPDGRVETGEGSASGTIVHRAEGEGGFGYDPIFFADELGTTVAAASPEAKRRVSHRARAVRALGARLAGRGDAGETSSA